MRSEVVSNAQHAAPKPGESCPLCGRRRPSNPEGRPRHPITSKTVTDALAGGLTPTEVAKEYGISRPTVYDRVREAKVGCAGSSDDCPGDGQNDAQLALFEVDREDVDEGGFEFQLKRLV